MRDSKGKIRKNFIYNISYEIFRILVPLITTPYISRVLGSQGIGTYTLASTYSSYFVMFGVLGLSSYAARELAYVREQEEKLETIFWEIFSAKLLTLGVATTFYILVFGIYNVKHNISYKICILYLVAEIFNISYYFTAVENFKNIVIRNVFIKLVSLICIFAFIRRADQVWLYTLILASAEFLGQVFMWTSLDKDLLKKHKFSIKNCGKHIKVSITLFIPSLAIQMYTLLDKVMLGEICGVSEVGIYENAQKIIRLSATVSSAIVAVSIPRMSNYSASKRTELFEYHLKKVFQFVSFLIFPMCFGLIAISKDFIPLYYGNSFDGIDKLFWTGPFLIISLGWSSIFGNMILITTGNQRYYSKAVFTGAIFNFILNIFLIPRSGALGAISASLIAEITGMVLMYKYSRKITNLNGFFKGIIKYLISSIGMFVFIVCLSCVLEKGVSALIVKILGGSIFYFGIMFLLREEMVTEIIDYGIHIIRIKK